LDIFLQPLLLFRREESGLHHIAPDEVAAVVCGKEYYEVHK
jgi:hypothetical protein